MNNRILHCWFINEKNRRNNPLLRTKSIFCSIMISCKMDSFYRSYGVLNEYAGARTSRPHLLG